MAIGIVSMTALGKLNPDWMTQLFQRQGGQQIIQMLQMGLQASGQLVQANLQRNKEKADGQVIHSSFEIRKKDKGIEGQMSTFEELVSNMSRERRELLEQQKQKVQIIINLFRNN